MSANFDQKDRGWLLGILPQQRKLLELEEVLVASSFDVAADMDIDLLEKTKQDMKFLKRVCLYKLLLFPLESLLLFVFFEAKHRQNKTSLTKLYYKFYINKINFTNFKKELQILLKDNIIS